MTSPSNRLSQAGISLPPVAAPVGSYVQARTHGSVVYVTGQLAFVGGDIPWTGRVGDEVTVGQGVEAARAAALNSLAAASDEVGGLDNLSGVLEVTGFIAATPGFEGLSTVLNGASDLFPLVFGEAGRHVRSNVGVAWLPLGSPVEICVTYQKRHDDKG